MPDNDAEIIELLRPHIQDQRACNSGCVPQGLHRSLGLFHREETSRLLDDEIRRQPAVRRRSSQDVRLYVVEVHPKAWQKAVGLTKPKKTKQDVWKRMLRDKAQELFPGKHITLKTADAYLILYAALTGKV
jgi:hypothetical protein